MENVAELAPARASAAVPATAAPTLGPLRTTLFVAALLLAQIGWLSVVGYGVYRLATT